MISTIISAMMSWLSKNVIGWVKNFFRKREEKKKDERVNDEAITKVKEAESKEERDEAVRDIGRTL